MEQNFRFASTVADRYYVMEHGLLWMSSPTPNWMPMSRNCTTISVSETKPLGQESREEYVNETIDEFGGPCRRVGLRHGQLHSR